MAGPRSSILGESSSTALRHLDLAVSRAAFLAEVGALGVDLLTKRILAVLFHEKLDRMGAGDENALTDMDLTAPLPRFFSYFNYFPVKSIRS